MNNRRSYSRLVRMEAWLLLDEDDEIVGSVRAPSAQDARRIFKQGGLTGVRVRRASFHELLAMAEDVEESDSSTVSPDSPFGI